MAGGSDFQPRSLRAYDAGVTGLRAALRDFDLRFAACWWVVVLWWSGSKAPAGYLLSFDDVWRLIHAHESSHGALAPSEVWPPLQFWVLGVALRIWADAAVVPRLVGLLVTAATLVQVGRMAGEMGLGRLGRVATMLSFGTLPYVVWLAPSALVEPWTLLAGTYALRRVRRWWVEDDSAALRPAFIALGLGAMTRYEAWGWIGLLAVTCLAARDRGRDVSAAWRPLALALAFPALWCVAQLAWTGNPFNFGIFAHEFLVQDNPDLTALGRAEDGLAALWEVVLPVGLGGLGGLLVAGPLRGLGVVIVAALAATALQVTAHTLGFAGLHNVWRHYLPLAIPVAIGVGALVDRLATLGRPVAYLGLALVLQGELMLLEWPPVAYEDDLARVATRLRSLRARTGGTVLIEAIGYETRVLQVLLGDMDDARFDRLVTLVPLDRPMTAEEKASNTSLFDRPFTEVEGTVRREGVKWIAVYTESALSKAKSVGTVVYAEPEHRVGEWKPEADADEGYERPEGRWVIVRVGAAK